MVSEKQAISLLKKYAPSEEVFNKVYKHSKKVQEISLRFASGKKVDKEFIKAASLLHDIGRFECPPGKESIKHGIAGASILRKEGLPEKLALVCERHLGAGISKKDIGGQKLPLPLKDYMPISAEEKIIAHADNLVFGDKEGTFEMVLTRFRKELGEKAAARLIKLKQEVENIT